MAMAAAPTTIHSDGSSTREGGRLVSANATTAATTAVPISTADQRPPTMRIGTTSETMMSPAKKARVGIGWSSSSGAIARAPSTTALTMPMPTGTSTVHRAERSSSSPAPAPRPRGRSVTSFRTPRTTCPADSISVS